MATSGSDRNWKGMFIATLVILAVFGLIVISVVLLTPPDEDAPAGEKIDFGDFLSNNLSGRRFNGTWISGEKTLVEKVLKCSFYAFTDLLNY